MRGGMGDSGKDASRKTSRLKTNYSCLNSSCILGLRVLRLSDFHLRSPQCARSGIWDEVVPSFHQHTSTMKIIRKNGEGESREALLKEYFLTASLIALLKRVGREAALAVPPRGVMQPLSVRH